MNNDLRTRVLVVLSRHHVRLDERRMTELVDDLCALVRGGGNAESWTPQKNENQRRVRDKNPAPGQRVCSSCRKTLPLSSFGRRDRGAPTSRCKNCLADYSRNRYVSARALRALNRLRLELVADDEFAGLRCLDCGVRIEAGDEVVCEAGLRHLTCEQEGAVSA